MSNFTFQHFVGGCEEGGLEVSCHVKICKEIV